MELYLHQKETLDFYRTHSFVYNASDPGTGKTRTCIELIKELGARTLVLAPKTILRAAWAEDIAKFAPGLTYKVLDAKERARGSKAWSEAQVFIMNHDGVKWLAERWSQAPTFDLIVVDEATAFKHRTSQRSRALASFIHKIPRRILMSGTPSPNGVLDLWHQYYLLDGGERLGRSFWRFRNTVCSPIQVGPAANHVKWEAKPGAEEAVADLVADITIRYRLEDCLDLPENVQYVRGFELSTTHKAFYERLKKQLMIELQQGTVTAVNAGARLQKLLQLLSGAVYDDNGQVRLLTSARYDLVADLVEEREASLVLFHWRHQREQLEEVLKKRKISYAVIDGSVSAAERDEAVRRLQNGELRVILAHPQSAGHGLTLTRATATIWCGPTYNAEHWLQANRRIYRAGQKRRTETITVVAHGTVESRVVERLDSKLDHVRLLSEVLTA